MGRFTIFLNVKNRMCSRELLHQKIYAKYLSTPHHVINKQSHSTDQRFSLQLKKYSENLLKIEQNGKILLFPFPPFFKKDPQAKNYLPTERYEIQ